jgi:DNA-binding CsgD family transcriptional regulator
VAAASRTEGAGESLNWLEAARDSTAIYDLQGKIPLAANSQFAGLQGSTDDGDALDQAIAELADQLRPEGGRPSSPGSSRKRVSLSGGEVTVQATWVSEAMPLPTAGILVRVVPDHPLVPPAAEISKRHGLSAREAEVAARLADGEALQRIAEALGISPHTARHHAEAAFKKLGVHSRGELIRVLLGR